MKITSVYNGVCFNTKGVAYPPLNESQSDKTLNLLSEYIKNTKENNGLVLLDIELNNRFKQKNNRV